jgi:thiol reductant ABC exporter CydC subunit
VRAFGTGKGVFRYAERLATHDTGLRSLSEIRAAVVARLAEIAPAGIPGWQRGDLLQRVVADVDRLLDLFVRVLGPLVAVAITALGVLIVTIVLDPAAGLVLLAALLAVGVVIPALTVSSEGAIGPALTDERARLGDRVLGLTERIDQRWADRRLAEERRGIDSSGGEIEVLESRRARVRMATGAAVTAAPLLTTTATLAAVATISGSLSGPVIGVLVLWPLALLELVGTTNEAWASVPSIAGAARRVVAVLDTPDPTPLAHETMEIGPRPDLLLDAVSARWPGADTDALAEVTIDMPAGSHVIVTGPSGSGKSTLAAVLVGFCAPRSGEYRVGPTSVEHVTGRDLRHHITWIQQLPWLADSTVRENLRIALLTVDDHQLVEALRSVRLGDWFGHLPAGLDTRIGRGGAGMSGGEAQRLALARVLLAGHDVVVLDEPTAQLDATTAQHVLDTVLDRCAERTTVLLTHEW